MTAEIGNINVTQISSINFRAPEADLVLDHNVVVIFHWVVFGVLNQMVDLFGIVTNIMNIICFFKQGFAEPVNVSFVGILHCFSLTFDIHLLTLNCNQLHLTYT